MIRLWIISLIVLVLLTGYSYTSRMRSYSIKFFSNGVNQSIDYAITVNGATALGTVNIISPSSAWINFEAVPGDPFSVEIIPYPDNPFVVSYQIKNGPNGSGVLIYDSKSTTFYPVNTCSAGECEGHIQTVNFGSSTVNVYINDVLILNSFEGFTTFPIHAEDSVKVVFTYGGDVGSPIYFIDTGATGSDWFYNAYGKNAVILNAFLSPFGGVLQPITQLQSRLFAQQFGPGSIWVPIRDPPF